MANGIIFYRTPEGELRIEVVFRDEQADPAQPHMGLITWKQGLIGKVLKSDIGVDKKTLMREDRTKWLTLVKTAGASPEASNQNL